MKFNLCLISNDLDGLIETEQTIKAIDQQINVKTMHIDFT